MIWDVEDVHILDVASAWTAVVGALTDAVDAAMEQIETRSADGERAIKAATLSADGLRAKPGPKSCSADGDRAKLVVFSEDGEMVAAGGDGGGEVGGDEVNLRDMADLSRV